MGKLKQDKYEYYKQGGLERTLSGALYEKEIELQELQQQLIEAQHHAVMWKRLYQAESKTCPVCWLINKLTKRG